MWRSLVCVLALAFTAHGAVLGQAPALQQKAGGREAFEHKQQAGKWTCLVKGTLVGSPNARALRYRQSVYRQGPNDAAPVLLFEESSTGRVSTRLRDDGLLLVQPVAKQLRLFFPGSADPVELVLPPPRDPNLTLPPARKIGECWFLGDVLFYHRHPRPGYLLIGFVRIDAVKKAFVENKLCLEIADRQQAGSRAAEVVHGVAFRAGEYVFWTNRGYHSSVSVNAVQGLWKSRKVRVLSLKTGELVELGEVPAALLKEHRERLLEFVERSAHDRAPELELWAVRVLSKIGTPRDAERLLTLYRSIRGGYSLEDERGRLSNGGTRMQEAYRTALKALGTEVK